MFNRSHNKKFNRETRLKNGTHGWNIR